MEKTYSLTKGKKFISVIFGMLLCSFSLSVNATHWLNTLTNLCIFGTVLTLYIYSFYGNKAKLGFELLPVGTVFAALCYFVPEKFGFAPIQLRLPLVFATGFAILGVFTLFVGTIFSKKKYKLLQYFIYVGTFLVSKFTLEYFFKEGLTSHIIQGISTLAVIAVAFIIFRDVTAGTFALVSNIFIGLFYLGIDILFTENKYSFMNFALPDKILPLKNYFLGLCVGLVIFAGIALLPKKLTQCESYRSFPFFKSKYSGYMYNLFGTFTFSLFIFPAISLSWAVFDLITARYNFGFWTSACYSCTVYSFGCCALIIIFAVILWRNMIDKNLPVPVKMKPHQFAHKALLAVSVVTLITSTVIFITVTEKTNLLSGFSHLTGDKIILNIVSLASNFVFILVFLLFGKRIFSYHQPDEQ